MIQIQDTIKLLSYEITNKKTKEKMKEKTSVRKKKSDNS